MRLLPETPVAWQRKVLTSGDFLATWVVELAVHQLDLRIEGNTPSGLGWARGTLEALFVTPVRSVEILLAKIIPCFLVGLLGLALCLLAARLLFHVPMYGSLLALLVSSMLYLFVALGIGLLSSAVTKNQFLASQISLLASFLPAMMLSGFIFDLRNVPTAVRVIGNLLPATYFMELVKSLFLAGDFWPLIIRNCLILAGYAVVLLGLAQLATRKRLD